LGQAKLEISSKNRAWLGRAKPDRIVKPGQTKQEILAQAGL